jgi:hypothetical protein
VSTREEWGIRVDVEHPSRSEKVGDIMTHLGEEKSRRCREFWHGWTPVLRTVTHEATPWIEVSAPSDASPGSGAAPQPLAATPRDG